MSTVSYLIGTKVIRQVVLIILCVIAISCSNSTNIIGNYKLYDLGGSNQAIGGNGGMTSVTDITAYAIVGTRIVFETGDVGLTDKNGRSVMSPPCRYGMINTSTGKIFFAKKDGNLYSIIKRTLMDSRLGVVSRSCIPK